MGNSRWGTADGGQTERSGQKEIVERGRDGEKQSERNSRKGNSRWGKDRGIIERGTDGKKRGRSESLWGRSEEHTSELQSR